MQEHPVLDFHNTVSWNRDGLTEERLTSPAAVAAWLREAKLGRVEASPALLRRALELRDLFHRVLTPLAGKKRPAAADLEAFRRRVQKATSRMDLAARGTAFEWRHDDPLDALVWQVARLLVSADAARLGHCANPDCGWLFLDRSRRGNRRWCEMSECGSRAKARAYYERTRSSSAG